MWLRDSSNQMQTYLPLLKANSSGNSIASLFRGVINLQARYLLDSPYCNSFQAPVESNISPDSGAQDTVTPPYSTASVHECKFELDSLAAFLQISSDYYDSTKDIDFFRKYNWLEAVRAVYSTALQMQTPTYADNGIVLNSPYTFKRQTDRSTETLANNGLGNPSAADTGLIRSAFRPSDDSTIYQFFIPGNMMFAAFLEKASKIVSEIHTESNLASEISILSQQIRTAIDSHGIVNHPKYGKIYAYEVDGFGSANLMDDANIPSLLSAPLSGFLSSSDPIYKATRAFVLSASNPYFERGPVLNASGGPHVGPGFAWPMASIVRILTSDDDCEIREALYGILSSTDGLGLIHESVHTFDASNWTREWFSWANGLFGQMILDLETRKPALLGDIWQERPIC
jgi:uncharacterized protein